jgi:hypothetical protein
VQLRVRRNTYLLLQPQLAGQALNGSLAAEPSSRSVVELGGDGRESLGTVGFEVAVLGRVLGVISKQRRTFRPKTGLRPPWSVIRLGDCVWIRRVSALMVANLRKSARCLRVLRSNVGAFLEGGQLRLRHGVEAGALGVSHTSKSAKLSNQPS